MIFTSVLGRLDGKTPNEAVGVMANHIRKMQEELEYRLMNLDSSNINEISAGQTTILLSDGTKLEDGIGGWYTEIQTSIAGIRAEVAGYQGAVNRYADELESLTRAVGGYERAVQQYDYQVSTFNQTLEGFTASVQGYDAAVLRYAEELSGLTAQVAGYGQAVQGYDAQVSTFNQTVGGFQTTVQGYSDAALGYANEMLQLNAQIQAYEQAVNGYGADVAGYAAQVSTFNQTVGGFNATVVGYKETVDGYTAEYSTFNQNAAGITGRVADLETGMSTTVKLDANGLYITTKNESGESQRESVGIKMDDLSEKLQKDLTAIDERSFEAVDTAVAIADGVYGGGTFIDGTKIYSPSIYSNEFSVLPEVEGRGEFVEGGGSFNLYGAIGGELYHFLQIAYTDSITGPYINFGSPDDAHATWDFQTTTFYGTVDFSKANVIWL